MINKKIKVLAVVSPKGGSGKTTTVANLGVALSQFNKHVLIVDTNITTASLSFHLGMKNLEITFDEVLRKEMSPERAIQFYNKDLHVIPSSLAIELRYEPMVLQDRIRKLTDHYDILLSELVKNYNLVILDSAPGFNAESIAAMLSADALLIVINPDVPTVITAVKAIEYAKILKRPVLGIVTTKVKHKSYELNKKEIERSTGVKVIGEINYSDYVPKSIANGVPVVLYKRGCNASSNYVNLARWMIGKKQEVRFIERVRSILRL